MDGITRLKFSYTNHRGKDHEYLVQPMNLVHQQLYGSTEFAWCMKALVIKRDGENRPGYRDFKLTGLRDVEEVPK